ncbi:MAG: hypothetical protein KF896_14455 [Ignavibacteriae bacterium]|nr:hypothetical protein [Ignavibacteriota bacterium]
MNYYINNGIEIKSEVELNGANGYPNAVKITAEEYESLQKGTHIIVNNKVVVKPEHVPTLEELKQAKLNELNNHFGAIFQQGYFDETTGWTLFCGESNINDYATLKNALLDMPDNKVAEIGTYTGWHVSTKAVIYPLLVRYSEYMMPLTTLYRKTKRTIENVQTEETLDSIQW